jgi:hypothetical protein
VLLLLLLYVGRHGAAHKQLVMRIKWSTAYEAPAAPAAPAAFGAAVCCETVKCDWLALQAIKQVLLQLLLLLLLLLLPCLGEFHVATRAPSAPGVPCETGAGVVASRHLHLPPRSNARPCAAAAAAAAVAAGRLLLICTAGLESPQ